MSERVLVFGTVCIDRIRRVPHLPEPGGYVEVLEEHQMLGGEAANTASALKAWGISVDLAGNQLGEGPDASVLLRLLRDRGLPLEHLVAHAGSVSARSQADGDRRDPPLASARPRTPVCDVYLTPDGDRTMFGRGFSDMRHTIDPSSLPYREGAWFTAEPNMGDAARCAATMAAEAGMRLYLMDFVRRDDPIAPGSYWQSSTDWAGGRNDVEANVEWVTAWVRRYSCWTILTDGAAGFVAGGPGARPRHYPGFPAPAVVDTTGAGDMFRAGVLWGLAQGRPFSECLKIGSAAGALKCRSLGGSEDIPSLEEVFSHIRGHPEVAALYD